MSTNQELLKEFETQARSVAPILVKGEVVAETDVESYFAQTFPAADQQFIEVCAAWVGWYMEIAAKEKR